MELTDEILVKLLDAIKDELAEMASLVYDTLEDGKVDAMEAMMLANELVSVAMTLVHVFDKLGHVGVEQFLNVLAGSDLKLEPRAGSDNPFKA